MAATRMPPHDEVAHPRSHRVARERAVLRIVKDARLPLWRVVFPDGRVSDGTNRVRARDGAEAYALTALVS
jgi:alkylated DNA nucleotide flippase Atl1